MYQYTIEERKQLEAIVSPEEHAIYTKRIQELQESLQGHYPPFLKSPIILPYFFAKYDQDSPMYQKVPIGKVGTVQTAGILPVIGMDLIDFYGNPLKIDLVDLCVIAEECHYRLYAKNPDGSLRLTLDGSPIGNGIRWTFNDKVLPWAGVKTQMTSSWLEVVANLKHGHPSIAILKNRDEVIIRGISSSYFYVIHGNKRLGGSFGEQIPIVEFVEMVKAIWLCKGNF